MTIAKQVALRIFDKDFGGHKVVAFLLLHMRWCQAPRLPRAGCQIRILPNENAT
jgi:hypothetical protein